MPPSETASQNTPLAPSVEKAFYRKCIQLKRRLNEVEVANDEAKVRRVRLERAIMKMRLERAFILDELRKRMDQNVDNSEGSGDEGMATPPPERPHRDKRRRTTQNTAQGDEAGSSTQPSAPQATRSSQRHASQHEAAQSGSAEATGDATNDGRSSVNGVDPDDDDAAAGDQPGDETRPTSRDARAATGVPPSTGPSVGEAPNGERKITEQESSRSSVAGDAGAGSFP